MFKLIHKDLKLKLLRTTPSAGSLAGSCSASCSLCSVWQEIAGDPGNKLWPGAEHLHNKGHGDLALARWLATKRHVGAYGSAERPQRIEDSDCKGIKAQRLLGSGSLLLSTQLKLTFSVCTRSNYFKDPDVWHCCGKLASKQVRRPCLTVWDWCL